MGGLPLCPYERHRGSFVGLIEDSQSAVALGVVVR